MPKKKHKERLDDLHKELNYKWEFLKRNINYQRDYKKFIDEKKKLKTNAKDTSVHLYSSELTPIYFQRNYHIREPIDPNSAHGPMSYDSAAECIDDGPFFDVDAGGKLRIIPLSKEQIINKDMIEVYVWLNRPKAQIMDELEQIIDHWLEARSKYMNSKLKRQRFKEWDQYLRIWDLRAQKRSFQQIGLELWPKEKIKISEDRAKKGYYRAHELIVWRKYDPKDKRVVRKDELLKTCETCQDKTCLTNFKFGKEWTPCPAALPYLEQDKSVLNALIPKDPNAIFYEDQYPGWKRKKRSDQDS